MPIVDLVERLFRPSAFNLLAPIVPGGILVVGIAALSKSAALVPLAGVPQAALTVFLAYAAGIVLYTLTGCIFGLFGHLFALLMGKWLDPEQGHEPWKDRQWRLVASRFVGKALCPDATPPVDAELFRMQLETMELLVLDPLEQTKKAAEAMQVQSDRQRADFDWFELYHALALWFPLPPPIVFSEYPFVAIVNATALAAIAALTAAGSTDWRLWLSFLVLLISFLYELVVALNYARSPSGRYYQMSGMLRLLRAEGANPGDGSAEVQP
jgi:hypothetical protein